MSVDPEVRQKYPEGVDRILELIGTATLLDSLKAQKRSIGCLTGILGGEWELKNFGPMAAKLTSYAGEASDFSSSVTKMRRYGSAGRDEGKFA